MTGRSPEFNHMNELMGRIFSLSRNPGIGPEKIEAFQSRYNISLPTTFKEFLAQMNGGEIHPNLRVIGVPINDESDCDETLDQFVKNSTTTTEKLLPFAIAGVMYAFDLNQPQPDGEYPILLWNAKHKIRKPTQHRSFVSWLEAGIKEDE